MKERTGFKISILFVASVFAAFLQSYYTGGSHIYFMEIAVGSLIYFVPAFLLGFMYKGIAGLIPGLCIIVGMNLLARHNILSDREATVNTQSYSQRP